MLGIAVAGLALVPALAATGAPGQRAKSGAVKPDFSYFAGKTITFVDGSAPGAGGDSYVRPLAPVLGSYLHATVNVVNKTGSGSVAAQDFVASAPPDGLTIGELAISSNFDATVFNTAGPSFTMSQLKLLAGAAASSGGILISTPSAPAATLTQFVSSKVPDRVLDITPGAVDLELRVFLGAYHVDDQLVTGYASDATLALGFQRGDAPYAASGSNVLLPFISAGTARPLLLLRAAPWPKELPDAVQLKSTPNVDSWAKAHPLKTPGARAAVAELERLLATPTYGFFAPAGTPANLVAALAAAFRSAMAQPSVRAAYLAAGNPPGYLSPAELLSIIKADQAHLSILQRYAS